MQTGGTGIFAGAGAAAERFVRRYMPDPFVLVLLLTLVALALGLLVMPAAAPDEGALSKASRLVKAWTDGFGNAEILKFGLQIILIVVTGEAIAASPPARRLLARLTNVPRTATSALFMVTSFALVTGWIHWGFGLVASALLAREVARSLGERGVRAHYALLGTGAYTSMLLWHAGLTASAPLLMNTEKNFVSDVLGLQGAAAKVPLGETVFAPYNLVACAVLALIVPPLVVAMHPREGIVTADPTALPAPPPLETDARVREVPADWLDHTRVLSFVTGALGLTFLVRHFREHGFDLNHNVVNCAFLMLGMVLHRSPVAYARAIAESVKGVSGIVLQFPFYGGILEVMRLTGLSTAIAHVFVAHASARTLPLFSFVASVLTKSFVPSGAGEWAVEGPVVLKAAQALGVPFGKVTMAVAYGNMLGNMYQPFWSLPLLGLMGLRAKDIMGFCLVLFVVCAPVLALALLL